MKMKDEPEVTEQFMTFDPTPPSINLPLGARVDQIAAKHPTRTALVGNYVRLVPLEASAHADSLFEGIKGRHDLWTYLFDGPFYDLVLFRDKIESMARSEDPLFFAIVDSLSGRPTGYASYMRVEPRHRAIEVGSILFLPTLQRTRGATEAMYMMAKHAFDDLGYRRYEWKCNSLNEPSRRAALRFGFQFEGIFRRHMIVKGRNRDTSWYSMIEDEWPDRKRAFERWLDPSNFDPNGYQRIKLSAFQTL